MRAQFVAAIAAAAVGLVACGHSEPTRLTAKRNAPAVAQTTIVPPQTTVSTAAPAPTTTTAVTALAPHAQTSSSLVPAVTTPRRTSGNDTTATSVPAGCSWAVNAWGNTDKPDPVYVDFVARRSDLATRTVSFVFDYTAPATGPASASGTTYNGDKTTWVSGVLTLTDGMAGGVVTAHARAAGSEADLCPPTTYTVNLTDPTIVRSDQPNS